MTEDQKPTIPFFRINYILIVASIVVLIVGYLLMAGGGSEDPNEFNPEVFSARRITVAPLVVLVGYAMLFYAILKRPGTPVSPDNMPRK